MVKWWCGRSVCAWHPGAVTPVQSEARCGPRLGVPLFKAHLLASSGNSVLPSHSSSLPPQAQSSDHIPPWLITIQVRPDLACAGGGSKLQVMSHALPEHQMRICYAAETVPGREKSPQSKQLRGWRLAAGGSAALGILFCASVPDKSRVKICCKVMYDDV
eukprot:354988-Chlamydomonas_euryale.AAC.13